MKPGLQMYSVRNQLTENFEATMEYLAKVGYKYIEGYGLGLDGLFLEKISASHYAKVIKDLGMELKATHCTYTTFENAGKMIDSAKETGMEYLIVPGIPGKYRETLDGLHSQNLGDEKESQQLLGSDELIKYIKSMLHPFGELTNN